MNDPDETMRLPVVEFSSESNGYFTSRCLSCMGHDHSSKEHDQEPSTDRCQRRPGPVRADRVWCRPPLPHPGSYDRDLGHAGWQSGIRCMSRRSTRRRLMSRFRCQRRSASADPGQYLDSQVLLLQSQGVAQQAANIANRELGANLLDVQDFYGNHSSLVVNPPATATPRRLRGHHRGGGVQGAEPRNRSGRSQRRAPGLLTKPVRRHKRPRPMPQWQGLTKRSIKARAQPNRLLSRLNGRRCWSMSRLT